MTRTAIYCVLLSLVASIQDVAALVATAPKVTVSAYEEARPMLIASQLIYLMAGIAKEKRKGNIKLEAPPGFPLKDFSQFKNESLDFRKLNDKKGLSIKEILEFVNYNNNRDQIREIAISFETELLDGLDSDSVAEDKVFLSTVRSLRAGQTCVYGVVKDTKTKRIIVSFRGTQWLTIGDWLTNFNIRMTGMNTPDKISEKMKGVVKHNVLVHRGHFEYLFNDNMRRGEQRYDEICSDIKPLMENGYSLYVTGHSLGGALASMFSFKIAGAGASKDWVPRPVSCLTFAATMSGSTSYRAAFEQEEADGLLRCLRINNEEDAAPAVSPITFGGLFRRMTQVGINCRLSDGGVKLAHSSQDGLFNKIRNVLGNIVLKPLWTGISNIFKNHGLPLHQERLKGAAYDVLSETMIDELYKDETVVGKDFLNGEVCPYDENEEEDPED